MKKTTRLFLLAFLMFQTMISCETDDIETGDKSFSCYINGELFMPKASTSISVLPPSEKLIFGRDSNFSVRATDHRDFKIFFNIENFDVGTFDLEVSDGNSFEY